MISKIVLTLAVALFAIGAAVPVADAQVGPGGLINPGRDCQTIRNCRFSEGGTFRGCVSSFSCRTCKLVATRCELAGSARGSCQKLRCSWGG